MNKTLRLVSVLAVVIAILLITMFIMMNTGVAFADTEGEAAVSAFSDTFSKGIASAIAIGLAAAGGAVAMGIATAKSSEAISRQPEAEGKIRSTFMLGLVFIETAIIYALLVVILIIFVI